MKISVDVPMEAVLSKLLNCGSKVEMTNNLSFPILPLKICRALMLRIPAILMAMSSTSRIRKVMSIIVLNVPLKLSKVLRLLRTRKRRAKMSI